MEINKQKNGTELNITLTGRLDTNTAPALQSDLKGEADGVSAITLDLSGMDYISSAGLRVLLWLHKECQKNSAVLKVTSCNDVVQDIFQMTGFVNVLNIQ
jgi:anti-sigma B factor antagonist